MGRIKNKYTITPTGGKIAVFESSSRLAGNSTKHKQGIWPAFWLMGSAYCHVTKWPPVGRSTFAEASMVTISDTVVFIATMLLTEHAMS